MAWKATITNVETRFDSVMVQIEVNNDVPPITFQKNYEFRNPDELTKLVIRQYIKAEIDRIGALWLKAEALKAEIGVVVNIGT